MMLHLPKSWDILNNVLPNKMAKAFPWYLLHPHHSCNPQAVVLTILGTRIFPRPHPQVRTSFEKTFDSRFDVLMTDVFDATGSDHGLGGPDKWISWWFCSQVIKLSVPTHIFYSSSLSLVLTFNPAAWRPVAAAWSAKLCQRSWSNCGSTMGSLFSSLDTRLVPGLPSCLPGMWNSCSEHK